MKRLKFILVLLVCLGGMYNVYADESRKVAVYVTGDGETGIKKILGDQLVSAFTGSGRYIAVERTNSFLAELRKEQMYQQTGAVDDRELSRLGIQFGVQFVCVAELNEAFGKKYVSCRLIDTESAEVVNTANETSELKDMEELLRVSQSLAKVLTGKTGKEKVAEKAAEDAKNREGYLKRQKEKEDAMAKGYIEVGNLMVTFPPKDRMTWKEAKNMAASITTGRFYDWRLPSKEEALIIRTRLWELHPYLYFWTTEPCQRTDWRGHLQIHKVGSHPEAEKIDCHHDKDGGMAVFVRKK